MKVIIIPLFLEGTGLHMRNQSEARRIRRKTQDTAQSLGPTRFWSQAPTVMWSPTTSCDDSVMLGECRQPTNLLHQIGVCVCCVCVCLPLHLRVHRGGLSSLDICYGYDKFWLSSLILRVTKFQGFSVPLKQETSVSVKMNIILLSSHFNYTHQFVLKDDLFFQNIEQDL